ncbi:hypothetical protein, partial [Stenotrophomonas maltophilia]|uniref:hypothetical protein n=1 Tax=Stenotrophomonas maltophilia TaxID=40324 RepID=UPI0019549ED0
MANLRSAVSISVSIVRSTSLGCNTQASARALAHPDRRSTRHPTSQATPIAKGVAGPGSIASANQAESHIASRRRPNFDRDRERRD